MKRVAVIIVTYNRLNLLKEEVESIRKQSFIDFGIIVVNNGSTDDTLEWLNQQSDITTITQDNQGCTGGMFTGIKYAVEHDYELCWVMDDDVEYREDSLAELVRSYDLLNGNIGFLCSKVEGINGEPMNVPVVDVRPTKNGYACYYDKIDEQMIKVEKATFVSLLFSSKVVKEVGLPLKEFFIWSDDYEYTERIAQFYPCYLCCRSVVVHKRTIQGALSFDTESDPKRLNNYFFFFRNNSFMVRKYMGEKAFWKQIIVLLKMGIHYFLHFNLNKSKVIFRALFASLSFKPIVKFPS